jgi:DNA polymerase III alpha subunit (gram-positive type)
MDCETGGLTTDYSLLTLAAVVADKDFNPLRGGNSADTLSLEIRHSKYVVSPEALTINKIDLVHHSARGLELEQAQHKFKAFLSAARDMCGDRLIPVGHNLSFDLNFVWAQLMPNDTWRRYCHYHTMDTMVAARFYKSAGVIEGGCSLVELCALFEVDASGAHNAMADTKATMAVARALTIIARGGV